MCQEMLDYADTEKVIQLDYSSGPPEMVMAPIQGALHGDFFEVSEVSKIEDLPALPERLRDFSFRYATEYHKTHKAWAKDYGVSASAIEKWLYNPKVQTYITAVRYQHRLFTLAQSIKLQRLTNETIYRILGHKLTSDTIGPIGTMARFMYNAFTNPEANKQSSGNMNILNASASVNPSDNPYRSERDVTPKRLEDIRSEIENLEALADGLGVDYELDGS
jgi:hypothetical protein